MRFNSSLGPLWRHVDRNRGAPQQERLKRMKALVQQAMVTVPWDWGRRSSTLRRLRPTDELLRLAQVASQNAACTLATCAAKATIFCRPMNETFRISKEAQLREIYHLEINH